MLSPEDSTLTKPKSLYSVISSELKINKSHKDGIKCDLLKIAHFWNKSQIKIKRDFCYFLRETAVPDDSV